MEIGIGSSRLRYRPGYRPGGSIELEQLDSPDPPLGLHRLYADRDCQLRRPGAGDGHAAALGDVLAAAPARAAPVHRPVSVRAAVYRPVAQREENMKKSNAPQSQSTSDVI